MSGTTTRLGLKTPDNTDPFLTSDFDTNYQTIDSYPGVFVCTSTTRPTWTTSQAGQLIFQTDNRVPMEWTGTAWREPLVSPSAWNLASVINTAISASASVTYPFSVGSFTSTRAGTGLVLAQLSFAPIDLTYAAVVQYNPIVNGSAVTGADGRFTQTGGPSVVAVGAPGGQNAPVCFGVCPILAGVNTVTVSVYFNSGAPPLTINTARVAVIMANTTTT